MRRPRMVPLALVFLLGCGSEGTAPPDDDSGDAGGWLTWVLQSGSEIPVPVPSGIGSATELAERQEIRNLQVAVGDSVRRAIARWDGPPALAWNTVLRERLDSAASELPAVRDATPLRAVRSQALLNIALHDAAIATGYHRQAYRRRAPWRADSLIRRLAADDGLPSYPSEHAAAAAAAIVVLSYLFPDDSSARYERLSREAAYSRMPAGVARRSDVEAGLALGRAVAQRVVALARLDGSDSVWTGAVPPGGAAWRPTPPGRVPVPYDPLGGNWGTWAVPQGSSNRPPAPPDLGSDLFLRDLDELRALSGGRTPEQVTAALAWAGENPSSEWLERLADEVRQRNWRGPAAARAFAYLSVAMYDGAVAAWDAKYTYWLLRPISADASLTTVHDTPPYPSYPSGHATIGAAAADVLAELFADRAGAYRNLATESAVAGVFAGVQFRFDAVVGEELGRSVGQAVVERMRNDGSAP